MDQLLLLGVCFAAGMALGRSRRMPAGSVAALNGFIITISLPALVLLRVHDLRLSPALLFPAAAAWIVFGVAALVVHALHRRGTISTATAGCLILVAGLGNTSFLGIPMIHAFYGADATALGVLFDQPGSFLILSTLGMLVAARFSGRAHGALGVLRGVLRFPPFIAFLLALALMPLAYPAIVVSALGRLGDTLAPLALVSVGMQLRGVRLRGRGRALTLGLGYKMIVAPALVMGVAVLAGVHGPTAQISVFEAAMPPMITGGIIAAEHDLDPDLAALMVGIGVPLAFVTLPLWWHLLGGCNGS